MPEQEKTTTRLGAQTLAKPPAPKPEVRKVKQSKKETKFEWIPFTSTENLPMDYERTQEVRNEKGKVTKPAVTRRAGTMHVSLHPTDNGGFEVIGHYRNGKGIARKMMRNLKVKSQNARGSQDRAFLKMLQQKGVQVMFDS